MVAKRDIIMNTRRKFGGLMKKENQKLKLVDVRSAIMPYDEIYYQRMDEPDIVKEISIAIKRAIDRMGKRSCA
ncbi:MAG: hypothetical protein ACW9XA_09065 [Candidatus Nitrosopumilus sp. bin_6a]